VPSFGTLPTYFWYNKTLKQFIMALTSTFNPYPLIGSQITTASTGGMDTIATAFGGGSSTVDDLVTAIYTYVQGIYYPAGGGAVPMNLQVEIRSVVYHIINAYNNKALGNTIPYNGQQANFINMMLGCNTTNLVPIADLDNWFADIEDNISRSGLSLDDQSSLLLASEVARSMYAYWNTQVSGGASGWTGLGSFVSPNTSYKNDINIPLWTMAAIEGALIGAKAAPKGLITPTTDIVTVNIISALIGALAIGAGKVLFGWVPRIQPGDLILSGMSSCNCNKANMQSAQNRTLSIFNGA
jgi:hypothetical protein